MTHVAHAQGAVHIELPRRLAAPEPTWTRDVDVVVLGSGAAGLAAALAPLVRRVLGEETIMDAPSGAVAPTNEDGRLRLARALLAA